MKRRDFILAALLAALLPALAPRLCAQPTRPAAGTEPALSEVLDFGREGLPIPPVVEENATTPRTVQLLGEAMRAERVVARRAQLADELGLCGLPDAMVYLKEAAADPQPIVRAEAARAAAMIGGPAAAELIRPLLADPEPLVRREAVVAGAGLRSDASDAAAAAGIADADAAVLLAGLHAARTADHAAAIIRRFDAIPQSLRPDAIDAIGRCSAAAQADFLIGRLAASPPERTAAVRALARLRSRASAARILSLARTDPHPMVRREAVRAAAGLADAAALRDMALAALDDPDPAVRSAAATVFASAPAPEAIDPLLASLSSEYRPLHDAARQALAAIGLAGIPKVQALLQAADPRRQEDGSWILGALRSDADLPQHIALLQSDDWALVAQAARSLGQIGRPEAAPALFQLLQRTRPLDRYNHRACTEAIIACGRLRYHLALPAIRVFLEDSDPGTRPQRAAAAWAFGVLAEPSDADTATGCIQLLGLLHNVFEVEEVKFECIKALGNLRYAPAADSLETWLDGADLGQSAPLKWMSHWAYQRITGRRIPYSPPVFRHAADVSITDLGSTR